jgi:hypothetical protein
MKGSVGSSVYPAARASSVELAILGGIWLLMAVLISAGLAAAPIVATLDAIGSYAFGPWAGAMMVVLSVAIPVSLAVAGVARIREAVTLALEVEPSTALRPLTARAAEQTAGPKMADGHAIPEVAIGRFGAAVFRQIPGDAAVRRFGDRFEFQVDGQWIPFDEPSRRDGSPLQVVSAPAESEFVAKVYAAVVTTAGDATEKPGCAILRPDQILPFLAGLPLRGMAELQADDSLSALVA